MSGEVEHLEEAVPTVYGIGLGPGDPGLVTLKALETLRACRRIFVPDGGGPGGSRAYRILEGLDPSLLPRTRKLVIPMGKTTPETWRRRAQEVISELRPGMPCAIAVEGDPLLYGSFIKLKRHMLEVRRHVKVEVISGIPSFVAAAARLGLPLASGRETVSILAGPLSYRQLEEHFLRHETVVLLKASSCRRELEALINHHPGEVNLWLVEDCGIPTERVDFVQEGEIPCDRGYFTLAMIKRAVDREDEQGGNEG